MYKLNTDRFAYICLICLLIACDKKPNFPRVKDQMIPDLFLMVLILSYVILTAISLISEWQIEFERRKLGHNNEDLGDKKETEESKEAHLLKDL